VLAVWGKYGSDDASLNLPLGVAQDAAGNVYVADSENGRIVVYPPVEEAIRE
jgi:DNA-binding beta-propeller fold protein YncE